MPDADDVAGRPAEPVGVGRFIRLCGQRPQQVVHRHRGDEGVVGKFVTGLGGHDPPVGIHGTDALVGGEVRRRQSICERRPDGARPAASRESEGGVGPPRDIVFAAHDVADHALEVHGGDALTHPCRVHLGRRVRPDLEVVRDHEDVGDAVAEGLQDPLVEVRRGRGRRLAGGQVDETVETREQVVLGSRRRLF